MERFTSSDTLGLAFEIRSEAFRQFALRWLHCKNSRIIVWARLILDVRASLMRYSRFIVRGIADGSRLDPGARGGVDHAHEAA